VSDCDNDHEVSRCQIPVRWLLHSGLSKKRFSLQMVSH
jgi:hypothetical protein